MVTDEMVRVAERAFCEAFGRDYDAYRGYFHEAIRAALTAAEGVGYAIVPVEPTQKMLDAAFECKERSNQEFPSGESGPAIDPSGEQYWRAMLAARPR